jgi:xanthine dehydrogenase YagS FAD-binding subunit
VRPFEFTSPRASHEIPELLGKSWGETEVLAGGTDLLSLMKDEITTPQRLVNIKDVHELHGVRPAKDAVPIGALTTLAELAESVEVKQLYPVLGLAAGEAASPQIRNLATLGGNLCQRPRCWYFRTGHGLLALDKDGKSLVANGDNRYHAILGNDGPAYFVSPSTVAPVLIAYGASVSILGPKGTREVPLEKFFVIPKSADEREHDLKPNEIVAEITLPGKRPPGTLLAGHYEVRQKEAFDWPHATAVAVLLMKPDNKTVAHARVVLGHVAPIPWVSQEAAQVLEGKTITEATADLAARAAVAKAKSLGRNAHKIQLARIAVKRAILRAGGIA